MKFKSVEKILSDTTFIEELEAAIRSGERIDYEWDGEGTPADYFDTASAREKVIELLKKYFTQKP